MRAFVKVVDAGSFAKAAALLGVSSVMITKQLAALERHLGARLLNRTTRRSSLTEAGADYYERCLRILGDIEEAEAIAGVATVTPRGTLRITLPAGYGTAGFTDIVLEFGKRYPEVSFDLVISDRIVDLVAEGIDLAIRITAAVDSPNLVARRVATTRILLCAAPAYLRVHGVPRNVEELVRHNCLIYSRAPAVWQVEKEGVCHTVEPKGSLHADDIALLHDVAVKGGGIAPYLSLAAVEELRAGRLQLIMADYHIADLGIYAVYPHRRLLTAKVRAFIDFLSVRLGADPHCDIWWEQIRALAHQGNLSTMM